MTIGEKLDWNEVEKIGIGALVASTVASVWAYFRSIGQKANKAEVDAQVREFRAEIERQIKEIRAEVKEQLEVINRRHSDWMTRSERYVTREVVDEMKSQIKHMDSRLDAQLGQVAQRLDGFGVSIASLSKAVEQLEKVGERLDKFIEGHR